MKNLQNIYRTIIGERLSATGEKEAERLALAAEKGAERQFKHEKSRIQAGFNRNMTNGDSSSNS